MTQPVRYVLHAPFFISSRLLPAVSVADATIHLQAAGIDHTDEHDPRVVWEYTIEGPSVYYAGRDLTTPYLGAGTVAGQLPAAMSTLLAYLSHLGDSDDRDDREDDEVSVPEAVYRWVRVNHDEITTIADLVDSSLFDDGPGPPVPASAVWWAITRDPQQTPHGRWCVGQATAHADTMATLRPRAGTAAGLVVRDERWHETALRFYTQLANTTEPVAGPDVPSCVVAGHDSIRGWLAGPAPDGSGASMAEFLAVGDFGLDRRHIADLVDQAQRAGLFGVPGHTIRAHATVDEQTDRVAHLLTVTTPAGTSLATGPVPADQIHRRGGPAAYAVVEALRHCAARVGDALTPHPGGSNLAPGQARPFPRQDPTAAAAPPNPPAAPPTPADPPRHAR